MKTNTTETKEQAADFVGPTCKKNIHLKKKHKIFGVYFFVQLKLHFVGLQKNCLQKKLKKKFTIKFFISTLSNNASLHTRKIHF
jgi:hypothetical protein